MLLVSCPRSHCQIQCYEDFAHVFFYEFYSSKNDCSGSNQPSTHTPPASSEAHPPARSQLCCRVLSLFEVRTVKSLGVLLTVGTCDIHIYWSSRQLVCVGKHEEYEAKVVGQSALFFSVTFLFLNFKISVDHLLATVSTE